MSESDYYPNPNLYNTVTPKQIAEKLFASDPAKPGTNQIQIAPENDDPDELTFAFETLISIYLEGLMFIMKVKEAEFKEEYPDMNTKEFNQYIFDNLSIDDLTFPAPWFKSMAFALNVEQFTRDEYYENHNEHYCSVIISYNDNDKKFFELKNIHEKYHFILHLGYTPRDSLKNVYAIFTQGDIVYKINFNPLNVIYENPPTTSLL
jgi:hypothetical protein